MAIELQQIMNRLQSSRDTSAHVKTASAGVGVNASPASNDQLRNAMRNAIAATEQEKTAGVGEQPTDALLKMAEDLSNAEDAALTKQASIYGAAMADGFMERYGQYEAVAAQVAPMATKTASVSSAQFEKFAAENQEAVKQAYTQGYNDTITAMEKQAADQMEYNQGYNDVVSLVHKTASECYRRGAVAINDVLRQL